VAEALSCYCAKQAIEAQNRPREARDQAIESAEQDQHPIIWRNEKKPTLSIDILKGSEIGSRYKSN
jgi:hypothetical protein